MAYVQIEADEVSTDSHILQSRPDSASQRIEEGPERLQFHCTMKSLPCPALSLIPSQLTSDLGMIQMRRVAQVRSQLFPL